MQAILEHLGFCHASRHESRSNGYFVLPQSDQEGLLEFQGRFEPEEMMAMGAPIRAFGCREARMHARVSEA